ncbi:hypothetical protein B0J14DRAFT_623598 [Halenospora varia]|nr:hypothetical protein B0J14DRAFT_623598 [Halenospora varia]
MSQSTENSAASDAPTRDDEQPEPLSFTLVIVSPSVGVSSPLNFPHLPATTTIKQLKAKIRDALPSKPVDESQRLIHRGRMLGRDNETMLDIFGQETLGNPESQTLHLVLRPSEGAPAGPSIPLPRPQSIPPNPLLQPQQPRPQSTPAVPPQGMHNQQPLPGFQHVHQHQVHHQAEAYHTMMAQRLQQLQRETQRLQQEMGSIEQRYRTQVAMPPGAHNPQPVNPNPLMGPGIPGIPPTVQNFIAQQQRDRAAEGRLGAGDNSGRATPAAPSSGRASPNMHRPDHTTTYTREGVGPNGERWQMTVNETTTTVPMAQMPHAQPHPHHHHHHPHMGQHMNPNPALDVQAVLRNADRLLATQAGQVAVNNMQRSASTPGPASSNQAGPPGSALASIQQALNTHVPSGAATPQPQPQTPETMVYLLSSSQGPRALLVSNSQTFFTPRQSSGRRRRHEAAAGTEQVQPHTEGAVGLPEYRNRAVQRGARRNAQEANEGQANAAQPVPHANPGAGALAAQVGPMLWLIVRLVAFVWFFTSGNSTWTRWFMVSGLAFVVFIINTGLFNGVADQVWGPVRRHLEALIPLAGPDAALVPAARGEPDPAQAAARLIEQRRQANGGWLMARIRRAEHALLLFMASLVPGVGERHIAAREAEATAAEAERQRLIDEAVARATAEQEGNAEQGAEGEAAIEGQQGEQNQENAAPAAPAPPLIEV